MSEKRGDGENLPLEQLLRVLGSEQVQQIDSALADLGPWSEVTIVKQRGRVCFIKKSESVRIRGAENGPGLA